MFWGDAQTGAEICACGILGLRCKMFTDLSVMIILFLMINAILLVVVLVKVEQVRRKMRRPTSSRSRRYSRTRKKRLW